MGNAPLQQTESFSEDAVFIVGAGHFGGRAARLIIRTSDAAIYVLDVDVHRLSHLSQLPVKTIPQDGIQFLVHHAHLTRPSHIIVPALPLHLAFEWLREYVADGFTVERLSVPDAIHGELPHIWPASDGSLLVSYADFVCPDDCPEPDRCTVTGERRRPLHRVLDQLKVPDYGVHVIRSRQLAPGLGGYRMADLTSAAQRLTDEESGKWLLGTSCRCHGIITALEIRRRKG